MPAKLDSLTSCPRCGSTRVMLEFPPDEYICLRPVCLHTFYDQRRVVKEVKQISGSVSGRVGRKPRHMTGIKKLYESQGLA